MPWCGAGQRPSLAVCLGEFSPAGPAGRPTRMGLQAGLPPAEALRNTAAHAPLPAARTHRRKKAVLTFPATPKACGLLTPPGSRGGGGGLRDRGRWEVPWRCKSRYSLEMQITILPGDANHDTPQVANGPPSTCGRHRVTCINSELTDILN